MTQTMHPCIVWAKVSNETAIMLKTLMFTCQIGFLGLRAIS